MTKIDDCKKIKSNLSSSEIWMSTFSNKFNLQNKLLNSKKKLQQQTLSEIASQINEKLKGNSITSGKDKNTSLFQKFEFLKDQKEKNASSTAESQPPYQKLTSADPQNASKISLNLFSKKISLFVSTKKIQTLI